MTLLIVPKDVESKFRFITVASQRAKQLQNGAKPRVETRSRKPTRVAMEEVLGDTVSWELADKVQAPSYGIDPGGSGEGDVPAVV